MSGMEVWGDLTLRGTGSLAATGSQCGIYAFGTLAVDGCKVDARSDGAGIADARVAGVIAGGLAVDVSWLDATGADAGVACLGGSLASARFVMPAGGAFGAGDVVDAGGTTAMHVVIEPESATVPVGETDTPSGEPSADVDPAIGGAATEQAKLPTVKPAVATKTTTTTAATKTTVAKASNPKSATATSSSLPKTADSHWIAVSAMLSLLGTALLATARRC